MERELDLLFKNNRKKKECEREREKKKKKKRRRRKKEEREKLEKEKIIKNKSTTFFKFHQKHHIFQIFSHKNHIKNK